MLSITISDEILDACPGFRFAAILCKFKNSDYNADLWKEIETFSKQFISEYRMQDIKNRPAILATRETYRALGKKPSRYRPASEALSRRILRGMALYQIDTAVDLINLISLKSGYSIGGFDADRVKGNLTLGVGQENEKFEAIGRGQLNIAGLPVYRDDIGGIGTPTSDEERTKITSETTKLLMIINGYSGEENLQKTVDYSIEMLTKYLSATSIKVISNLET